MDIISEPFKRPEPAKNKFLFFFTGSPQMLTGIDIDLDLTFNPHQCKEYLKSKLPSSLSKYDLIVYLSGGIPFLGGTLQDLYNSKTAPKVKPYIYGILTRPIRDEDLLRNYPELCNTKDLIMKTLLSPLCESSKEGLVDISCLLGYLNHDGILNDKLLKTCAAVIPFPPLITCLNRVMERNGVTGLDVVTITSSLQTYFHSILLPSKPIEKVLEFSLQCCNVITSICDYSDTIPMQCAEVKNEDEAVKFLSLLKQPKMVYFWKGDSGEDFTHFQLKNFDMNEYINKNENENKSFASFTPIAPLSIRVVSGCSIVKGKEHNYLYISKAMSKGPESMNMVDIIDPVEGMATSVDVEKFAKLQGNDRIDDVSSLIDTDKVKQVIFICFDHSGSMKCSLGGYKDKNTITQETQTRAIIATQYLTSLANKTYGYHIPCVQGLIAFNSSIEIKCPLNALVPDFEEKGLKEIAPNGKTLLWDALSLACDELVKFTTFPDGRPKFKKARNRILVISDGDDFGSKTSLVEVSQKLLKHKILTDSVIVSTEEKCKELVTLCHITGGLAFNPISPNEGLLLFDKSAFLNIEERIENTTPLIKGDRKTRPKMLKPEMITPDFIKEAVQMADFDTNVENIILQRAIKETRLATPKYICYINQNDQIQQPRRRRILRELHYAALVMDKESQRYDEDLVVLPFGTSLDVWQVFIRGPIDTPYEKKWFFLNVTFPDIYPNEPPVFRFISIPYHLNVSSEGRICFDIIEKGYISYVHVIDILQQIKELFLIPCPVTPIQIGILETFMSDNKEYERLAKESAQKVGKDKYEDFLPPNKHIQNEVDDRYKLTFDGANVPAYMVSQISGRVIKDPVRSSTGVIYEREELRQHVKANQNPICVITGRPLTEKVEEIDAIQ
ncbi:hypothetical protein M9Y10_014850 [Tritrichomonas musculus]|uniref:UBC core domain-containing protein n=1 Tax=Tritrichomonas musculus TaxID=1915356 RepID=A0ABR2L0N0_9EUKA